MTMSRRRRRLKRNRKRRQMTNRSEGYQISLINHPDFNIAAVLFPEYTKLLIETILRLDSKLQRIR